ncbi:MAG: hypothetical protein JRE47_12360 [Deltaproteobacteria bacterium]|nr:hypothetical protein [Deltaproteobacteria bacterium]
MKEEDKIKIEHALDALLDNISENMLDCQKFEYYSPFLKFISYKKNKIHRQSRRCIYPKCTKRTIKKSHSIPKSASLNIISENGHVLKPDFDEYGKELKVKIKSVGINNASAFPGFCEEHERLFSIYENDAKIDTYKKALLQSYRAICREIVVRKNDRFVLNQLYREYKDVLEKESLKCVKGLLKNLIELGEIKQIKIDGGDGLLLNFEKQIKYINKVIVTLEDYSDTIISEITSDTKSSDLILSALTIDYVLPIALCGFANSELQVNGSRTEFTLIMNIVPINKETYIICATNKKNKEIFDEYMKFCHQHHLSVLNMVESFMIFGSDHWFIQPSKWHTLPDDRKEILLADILQSNESFLEMYPLSIFDEARKTFIDLFLRNTKDRKLTNIEKDFIDREKNKLYGHINRRIIGEDELIQKLYKHIE